MQYGAVRCVAVRICFVQESCGAVWCGAVIHLTVPSYGAVERALCRRKNGVPHVYTVAAAYQNRAVRVKNFRLGLLVF